MTKAWVTGATGYIGYQLTQELLHRGWEVTSITRETSDTARLKSLAVPPAIRSGDLSLDQLTHWMTEDQPKVIFHLAAMQANPTSTSGFESLIESNLLLGARLLESMKNSGVRNLINTSSYWAYDENGNYFPNNLYAATKGAVKELFPLYTRLHDLRITSLILFDVYGQGDWRKKFLPSMLAHAMENRRLAASTGDQLLDWIFIDDVVEAYMIAAQLHFNCTESNVPPQHYTVGTGRRISLRETIRLAECAFERQINVDWGKLPKTPYQIHYPMIADKPLPGWSPQYSIEDGLAQLIKSYQPQVQNA